MKLIDADKLIGDCNIYNEWDAQIVKMWVDDQPTVDATPVRHGHWVGIDDEPYEVWECDRCGYTYESEHRYNYCPHCGADMREGNTE